MLLLLSGSTKTHRGTTTVNHNTGAGVTITTDVDVSSLGLTSLEKSAEKLKGFTINGGAIGQARLWLTSLSNLRVVTYSSQGGYTLTVEWEIEAGSNLSVTRVTTTHTTGVADYCAETNETITSLGDTSQAEAVFNGCTCGTGHNLTGKVKLASATSLNVKNRAEAGGVTITAQSLVLKRAA
ncbi:MAG: hypothetical protein HY794_03755 [Desulfarculus sp.]|nr:hypothetical protein [Desulfarculus sp.]